jgi:hypothetical protein
VTVTVRVVAGAAVAARLLPGTVMPSVAPLVPGALLVRVARTVVPTVVCVARAAVVICVARAPAVDVGAAVAAVVAVTARTT